ncbi:hypothetical protein NE237_018930 [Protea cynaroides]|uniref:Uncharacterized protein n=1 Tax=Protea cynaroides TaxID=273540 RepID=A0A9Q0KB09_9MAGN|nr:hypothetical protein NE237_018930 [Protea cynaroides]
MMRGMYIVEKMMSRKDQEEEEEEEEALSLCDLPVVETTKDENESSDQSQVLKELQEDEFEFGPWGAGSLLREFDMCAADEVFFQGQILPLRLSDGGIAGIGRDSQNPSRCASRSESITSSSRSSSIRSRISNSSSSGSSIKMRSSGYRERELSRNHSHAHQSPRPQIWPTSAPPGNGGGRSRRSTGWILFRPGLVRTPEIELHDLKLKLRNRNKSCENSSKGRNSKNDAKEREKKLMKTTKTQGVRVKLFDGFTSGCKCSVSAVGPIPSRIASVKKVSASDREENKLHEDQQQKQGKQAMAHYRTFEWLKQLSLADQQQEA